MPDPTKAKIDGPNRYKLLIESIFFDHWSKGVEEFEFHRDDLKNKCKELAVPLPDNLGERTLLVSLPNRTACRGSRNAAQEPTVDHRRRRPVPLPLQVGLSRKDRSTRGLGRNRDSGRDSRDHSPLLPR